MLAENCKWMQRNKSYRNAVGYRLKVAVCVLVRLLGVIKVPVRTTVQVRTTDNAYLKQIRQPTYKSRSSF